MKVVILCGGEGTRLRAWGGDGATERLPKPMVQVGGRPILWHIMRIFAAQGFTEFVLCLGHRGEVIRDWVARYPLLAQDFTVTLGSSRPAELHGEDPAAGWRVTCVDTGEAAMTGARLARVAPWLGERFFVTYGDGVADIDVGALRDFHVREGRLGTVTGVHPPARFGELAIDGPRVRRFEEKPQVRDAWINGGFFVFERAFLDRLTTDDGCVLEREPLVRLADDGQLSAWRHHGFWQCMDTLRDVRLLNELWAQPSPPWAVWDGQRQAPVKGATGS